MAKDKEKQISAYVSERTNERLDMYVRETGVKKARLIEDAIVSHLDALESLPADAIIPTRIVVSQESWDRLMERLESPPNPTPALRKLMQGRE
jgi:uncharacterized protein (DUF1778 family)